MTGAPAISPFAVTGVRPLAPGKFRDPDRTADGELRAKVRLERLETLWINSGTLCNLACPSCYIHSSPTNYALVYPTLAEVESYLDEALGLGATTIGFTGGEPFMNPDLPAMMEAGLARGFSILVLTNAMRPMRRFERVLAALAADHGTRIVMRVSLDHHERSLHEAERGDGSWDKALDGLAWLSRAGFRIAIAGRRIGPEAEARPAFLRLAERLGLALDHLVLFPTIDDGLDVPEISHGCWEKTGVDPSSLMCASSRMVVKAKGAPRPHVVACTLLPHDPRFALGERLGEAVGEVALNHPHCARFCVLGGASCTG